MKRTKFSVLNGSARNAVLTLAVITMLAMCVLPASARIQYGVRCEETFQNNWFPYMPDYPGCDAFINQIGKQNIAFDYNLHGAAPAFQFGNSKETSKAWGGVDSVDFFFLSTQTTANNAGYAMWDDNSMVWASSMRLGDAGEQVKVLASLACFTFYNADGHFWNRWGSAFSGGLKIGVGAHGIIFDSTDESSGQNFALHMQENNPIGSSWLNALYDADNGNTPTVANTGTNSADCWNRQAATLSNIMSLPTLRDGQIGYVCWTNWN